MTTYDRTNFEILVPARISFFSDQTPVQGDGNGGEPEGGSSETPPSTPSQQQGTNWEAAYKTLQKNHSALQAQSANLEGQVTNLTAQLATRANEIADLTNNLDATTANATQLQTQVETFEGQVGSLEQTVARQKLIMGEFPQLAKFEAQGLLPQAEGEDAMREVLTTFAATIEGIQQGAVAQVLDGASPEPVPGENVNDGKPVTLNSDQAWDKVVEVSKAVPMDEAAYQKAYDDYLEILQTEQGEKAVSGYME